MRKYLQPNETFSRKGKKNTVGEVTRIHIQIAESTVRFFKKRNIGQEGNPEQFIVYVSGKGLKNAHIRYGNHLHRATGQKESL
jgi:hypothetical protein